MKKETKKILKSLAWGYGIVVLLIFLVKRYNLLGIPLVDWSSFQGIFLTLAFGFISGALIKSGFYE